MRSLRQTSPLLILLLAAGPALASSLQPSLRTADGVPARFSTGRALPSAPETPFSPNPTYTGAVLLGAHPGTYTFDATPAFESLGAPQSEPPEQPEGHRLILLGIGFICMAGLGMGLLSRRLDRVTAPVRGKAPVSAQAAKVLGTTLADAS